MQDTETTCTLPAGVRAYQERLLDSNQNDAFFLVLFVLGALWLLLGFPEPYIGIAGVAAPVAPILIRMLTGSLEDDFFECFNEDQLKDFCKAYADIMTARELTGAALVGDVAMLQIAWNSGDAEDTLISLMHMVNKIESLSDVQVIQQDAVPPVRDGEEPAQGGGA